MSERRGPEMDDSRIIKTEYSEEMQKSFIDYAMSVIIARALPDVRDGLKPVQRRTLYDMHELGIRYDRPYRKSARIVGDTMGKYHPHGDSSIYEALVVMSQDFKKGMPLIDGHGNFGTIDRDPAAAMRYTEARLQKVSEDVLLADLDKAEKFIFLEFFILRSGKMWDGVEQILRRSGRVSPAPVCLCARNERKGAKRMVGEVDGGVRKKV